MSHSELDDPTPLTPCRCANGHGQMLLQWALDAPGLTVKHWTWICPVCREERMWPDDWPAHAPA